MASQLLDSTLGNIACSIPGATRVFHEFHLDFCCGGQKSLRQAALERGIDADRVQQRLLSLSGEDALEADWRKVPQERLIEHILQRYHEVHRAQLPELIRLAARVEQVHGGREHCPQGLTELLIDMQQVLESHMQKEEQILFPMLQRGGGVMAGGPISVMRYEHDQHGDALERIVELTDDMQPPANACNTWRALYRGLDELRRDLMQHIHLENNLLFPRALGEEVQHG
ncbi:MAG: iron-sulfur cluster repair protein YtfE [Pseudomonadaceae bacterium]|nr:iron-sulfur cluster repair protein YtfE [Pseudomonadaceae bacterium]